MQKGRKKRRKGPKKKFIQIKNSNGKWVTVQLLKEEKGKILVRMKDGQVIRRHAKRIRLFVQKRVNVEKSDGTRTRRTKQFKTKKKSKKSKNTGNKRAFRGKPFAKKINAKTAKINKKIDAGLRQIKSN